jgi:hypothetical protein
VDGRKKKWQGINGTESGREVASVYVRSSILKGGAGKGEWGGKKTGSALMDTSTDSRRKVECFLIVPSKGNATAQDFDFPKK